MEFDLTAMIALTLNAKMPLTIIKESIEALCHLNDKFYNNAKINMIKLLL
jgi:hypothetical protein